MSAMIAIPDLKPSSETAALHKQGLESSEDQSAASLRQQMYERIARGSALAEVEIQAHRRWRNA
jgi:hypothetical protein